MRQEDYLSLVSANRYLKANEVARHRSPSIAQTPPQLSRVQHGPAIKVWRERQIVVYRVDGPPLKWIQQQRGPVTWTLRLRDLRPE